LIEVNKKIMFKKLKNFATKKMLKKKMGGDVSDEKVDQIMDIVQANPELFNKIGEEIKAKVKQGRSETAATMEVMRAHQAELQKLQQR